MNQDKYEFALSRRQRHGEKLTPEEETRLEESKKSFRRNMLIKIGIIYIITFPILGMLIYAHYHPIQ
jgi:hypothetical protein